MRKPLRRRGIAASLLAVMSDRCRALGVATLWLNVNKHNTASIAAYERMGFIRGKAIVQDIGNGFVMDDYIMTFACRPPVT